MRESTNQIAAPLVFWRGADRLQHATGNFRFRLAARRNFLNGMDQILLRVWQTPMTDGETVESDQYSITGLSQAIHRSLA